MKAKLREIRKQLMSHTAIIKLSDHCKNESMEKRGYTKTDIVICLMQGEVTEVGYGYNKSLGKKTMNLVVEGKDAYHNPVVVVIGIDGENEYTLVTVFPPIDRNRFKVCISN